MKRLSIAKLVFLLFLIVASVAIIVSHNKTHVYTNHGNVFGTYYHITYTYSRDLQKDIDKRLAQVDASLSAFNPKSVITRVNKNQNVRVDSMFRSVFTLAQKVSADTYGAFDITVAPLVNAWGFGFEKSQGVSPDEIKRLQATVGYTGVSLSESGRVMKRNPATQLDCSAIAKGYGCDMVAALFDSMGISSYLIEIGGEIVAKGHNPDKEEWKVGINKPVDDSTNIDTELSTVIRISNCGLATSGNYRRFYYKDGKRYAHTIDPRSGYPVQHTLLSSTVIAPNCATADAYATAFMVLGVDSARIVLSRHPELKAYFIYSGENGEYKVWMSPSLKNSIIDGKKGK